MLKESLNKAREQNVLQKQPTVYMHSWEEYEHPNPLSYTLFSTGCKLRTLTQ